MEDEITRIDVKIEMVLEYMRGRRGRDRNSATTNDIAKRLKAGNEEIDRIMRIAHERGLVFMYPKELQNYYVIRVW